MANCGLGQVVLESLRMASIISFPFREAIADVEYKGKKDIYYICKTSTLFKKWDFFFVSKNAPCKYLSENIGFKIYGAI